MIEIIPTDGLQDGEMPLGRFCGFHLDRSRPSVETRWFLNHNRIWNVKPLCDWTHHEELKLFPEAPGHYTLAIQWRDVDGSGGWVRHRFLVNPAGSSFQPTRAGARQGLEYWAPNANEAQGISAYESALLARLSELVPAGAVVYDIGANIGLYAAPLSRAVGENGQVLCFEPNPVCIAYLQANLERNRCDNCRILPLAITAGEDRVPFTINFANTLLGLSHNSAFYGSKVGQEVLVPGSTLDRLTVDMELPDPTVMKIDVEGAEHALLPGMEAVLERARPLLLFEIHGEAVAAVVLPFLDRFGYRYEDADLGSHFADAPALLESFAKGVRQIICHPPTDA